MVSLISCGGGGASALRGDWDYYRMLGAKPSGGFDALRRFGFAHFEKADTTGAWINRRNGARMERIHDIVVTGDSLVIDLDAGTSIRARISKDTIAGQYYRGKNPTQRVWFVRRKSPPVYEPFYALWPGPVSDSSLAVTIDPAVPMKARDGTVLMNFVGTPSGKGPFGVVMERTPYLRIDTAAAMFWASRGYIYVKQDVRGRGGSGGVLDMNAMQEQDGYDAVEWAANLPGSNGKVGMIGRSNPGLYAWYAAIAAPPHLAAIAPGRRDRGSAAHRAVHRHGVLAHHRALALPHAGARDDVGHEQPRRRDGLQQPAGHRERGEGRVRAAEVLERLVRSPEARRLLARPEHRGAAGQGQGAGARHRRLVRRCARHDPQLHGDRRRCTRSPSSASSWMPARTRASTT